MLITPIGHPNRWSLVGRRPHEVHGHGLSLRTNAAKIIKPRSSSSGALVRGLGCGLSFIVLAPVVFVNGIKYRSTRSLVNCALVLVSELILSKTTKGYNRFAIPYLSQLTGHPHVVETYQIAVGPLVGRPLPGASRQGCV